MFTGIVQDVGSVVAIDKQGDWTLTIRTGALSLAQAVVGGSMACNGVCLTMIAIAGNEFKAQASTETLNRTTMMRWREGTQVNLEPALRFGDEMGGHLVTGHVDGVAYLVEKRKEGDSLRLRFEAPESLRRFLAPKGSVALDGVSLTVNEVERNIFGVNIIPHTQQKTTLTQLALGDAVDIEADMLARYAERILRHE